MADMTASARMALTGEIRSLAEEASLLTEELAGTEVLPDRFKAYHLSKALLSLDELRVNIVSLRQRVTL